MKKIQFLLLFLFFSTSILFAQQKKYISYTVKEGETLKSIANEYNLSKRDLKKLNPGVDTKPEPNTIIIVPNKNFGQPVVEIIEVDDDLYTVQPKETLYGISKKFGITIDELKTANTKLENGVKIGMKLVIPGQNIPTEVKDSINYVLHTVIKDDTVYNLTKRYQVTSEKLLKLNPKLSEGLKLGMLLIIKPIEVPREEVEEEINVFKEELNFNKELKVVLMLPYQLNKLTDSIRDISFGKSNSLLNIATDFHLGTQMAIDSLRRKGLKIRVEYFDTERSEYKLQLIVNKNDFNATDVVIGPLYFESAHWISKRIKAPVVAPVFSNKQAELSADNLIQSSPNMDVYEERLLDYMDEIYEGENIVVINDENPENQTKLWRIVNKLKTFDSVQNIVVVKPEKGFINIEKFKTKLNLAVKNWVLIISDDNITTAAAINNLKTYVEDIDISLFALNKGSNFDNIDNSFLGKLNFVFPTSEFIDINDFKVQQFYKKYKSKNFALPSKYAIRGFDVTFDALIRVASAENLDEGLKLGKSNRIASMFDYNKKMVGSFENRGVFLIQYTKDLNTIILE